MYSQTFSNIAYMSERESLDVNREAFLDAGHVEDELRARGAVAAAGQAVVGAVVRPAHVADEQLRHPQPRLRGGGAHAGPGNHGRDIRHDTDV